MLSQTFFFLKSVLCLLLMLLLIPANAQSRYNYKVEKVIDDVYVLRPQISDYRWVSANIVVIVNEADVFVVDSGLLPSAAEEAIIEIKNITSKPVRYLLNTHWHGDHWQGNDTFAKAYPGVQIIATEQGYKGISRNGMVWATKLYRKYFENYSSSYEKGVKEKKMDGKSLSADELDKLKTGLAEMKKDLGELNSLKTKVPDITFAESMTIFCGKREFNLVYLGIGNTSGDAVLYLPQEKLVVSGDLVVYPSPYESGMFSPEWLATSEKLDAIDFNYLIPGHGEAQADHGYLRFLNAFYKEIISEVVAAYKDGITGLDDIRAHVTHQRVVEQLAKDPANEKYVQGLDPGFVPGAIRTSYLRIIQGKQ